LGSRIASRNRDRGRASQRGERAARGAITAIFHPPEDTAMKLYWGPHTCAIGIHVLLEEIGRPYETEQIDVAGGATHKSPFLAINPKGKVPTLTRDDGSVLTEFGAIANWLARTNPDRNLLPTDPETQARAVEMLDYAVGTIHGQGFGRIFSPERFEPPGLIHETLGVGQSAVKKKGREMAEKAFAILDLPLSRQPYAAGDTFTIADAALFYVERWAEPNEVRLTANVVAHLARMKERPAIRRVMQIWGETLRASRRRSGRRDG
jgi:glutathione S-transferase